MPLFSLKLISCPGGPGIFTVFTFLMETPWNLPGNEFFFLNIFFLHLSIVNFKICVTKQNHKTICCTIIIILLFLPFLLYSLSCSYQFRKVCILLKIFNIFMKFTLLQTRMESCVLVSDRNRIYKELQGHVKIAFKI